MPGGEFCDPESKNFNPRRICVGSNYLFIETPTLRKAVMEVIITDSLNSSKKQEMDSESARTEGAAAASRKCWGLKKLESNMEIIQLRFCFQRTGKGALFPLCVY